MNVLMYPHLSQLGKGESGIKRVVEAYFRYLPEFDVNMVTPEQPYDLVAAHAGTRQDCQVAHCHGLYFTADYDAESWEWTANSHVIASLLKAKEITVPSEWVSETIKRDMRRVPHIVGHGIEWDEWAHHNEPTGDYALWNKNRMGDVCDPRPVLQLARRFVNGHFVTTFAPRRGRTRNLNVIGTIPHREMKKLVQSAAVYLSTTKETFGIGTLEAMASGVPVLGYAYGGNLQLVKHGVTGYLAKPGNLDDLCEGMLYCLRYRDELGANGREVAKTFTWQAACEQVAEVYRLALIAKAPSVAIIIPSYNYADKVGRAIESACKQTYGLLTDIVVVDDGSNDDGATEAVVAAWSEKDDRVRYIRQNNAGVAIARNRGISEVETKYVCCLDADDALTPGFLEPCVRALEADNALGIAYTGLYYHTPDGREGLSQWPGESNFDAQLQRKNQIPTCCVFRRDMWASLGGYRQRYAPRGAGEEDAEFWTRCGAYGWGAKKVTTEGLFLYSWQSGRVSGGTDHPVTDWLGWHPWVTDGQHPFASAAQPARQSHPVRQYDEPLISVIIPVGPGHERDVINALDSLEAQTFRKWEVIIAWDAPGSKERDALEVAFPYARWVFVGEGQGAGSARNRGAEIARAPFLLFLDADDHLYPQAMERMLDYWEDEGPACIYTDYVGKAYIDDVSGLADNLQARIRFRDEKTNETVIGYQAFDYDWERAQAQPVGDRNRPYIWCNITTLVPRVWHDEVGGFDESMRSWEDWDYWLRIARRGKKFVRIPEELLVYRFYTGTRREIGRKEYENLFEYLTKKYEGSEVMSCTGCKKQRANRPSARTPMPSRPAMPMSVAALQFDPDDFVLCDYVHQNRGSHPLVGGAKFDHPIKGMPMIARGNPPYYKINYRYRAGGDRFLVHKADIRLAPHLFIPVKEAPPAPQPKKEPVTAPPEIAETSLQEPGSSSEPKPEPELAQKPERKREPERETVPPPPLIEPTMIEPAVPDREETVSPLALEIIARRREERGENGHDLQRLPGIGAVFASKLNEDGIHTYGDVVGLGIDGLAAYKGIGEKKATFIIEAAERAL